MECHVNRVAAPKRSGIQNQKENQTLLTITKIHKLPWDAAPAKAKKATKTTKTATTKKTTAKTTTASSSSTSTDVEAIATEFILGVLADDNVMKDYPDGIPKAKLAPEAFAKFPSDDPNRQSVVRKVFEDAFLGSGPWAYDAGKLTMG